MKNKEKTPPALQLTQHRITVLLVDDQAIIGEAVRRMLATENDIDFHYCQNPIKAINIANQIDPTVILQDLVMPEIEGLLLVRYFRANRATQEVPLIVLSSKEEPKIKAEAFALGANDYMVKFPDKLEVIARIRYHSKGYINLLQRNEAHEQLERANRFIRQTFGRYLSEDIVNTILESPNGLKIGGEKRLVTILMSDLRGFTAIGERLSAETVLGMLNLYLEAMTDIIFTYQGTIDEFIGDAILSIFGAPIFRENDAQRAVACALEMQLAMEDVNAQNRNAGYPDVAMGIGINTGELVVGNVGSHKRTKYGVVGRNVNLTSRIESYTVGGQVLVSQSTVDACGGILRIDNQIEVMPKGVPEPIQVYDIGGIGGEFNIFLPQKDIVKHVELEKCISIQFTIIEKKHTGTNMYAGTIIKLLYTHSTIIVDIQARLLCQRLANLKLTIFDDQGHEISHDLYGKVVETLSESPAICRVSLTSIPPEVNTFFSTVIEAQGLENA